MANVERPAEVLRSRNPQFRDHLADHGDTWMLLANGLLNLYGDLDREDAGRIGQNSTLNQIQFARKFDVSLSTLRNLNDYVLAQHPQAHLRETFNGCGAFEDLDHLVHLPGLRSLGFLGSHAVDVRPVQKHGAIESIGVGGMGTSLLPLEGQRQIKHFGWCDRLEHVQTIASFPNLETLGIFSQSLKDLSFLSPLRSLRSISFSLGGTRHFADLPAFPALAELSIWRTSKLDVELLFPINQIGGLKRLMLSELPRITTLDWLTNPSVRLLDLDRLRGLRSYASLEAIPGLETLVLRDKFTAENIAELSRLPSLKTLYVHENPLNRLRLADPLEALPFAIRIIDFARGKIPDSDESEP